MGLVQYTHHSCFFLLGVLFDELMVQLDDDIQYSEHVTVS